MRRGEIWTVAGGPHYAGKPRPVVILQGQAFAEIGSVTICPFTTDPMDLPVFRIAIEATAKTGLRASSRIMIDKVMTVPRSKLGLRIGQVSATDLRRVDRALTVFLGLAD
jgi:mRNA interferase MazF